MAAKAQVHVGIQLGLPVLPRLELVAPGVQVVTGFNDEVFLQGGWYWARRSDGWYRSRSPQANFDYVDARRVPRGIYRMPEGRYRNFHAEGWDRGHEGGHDRGRGHEEGGHDRGRGHEEGGRHNEGRGEHEGHH